MIPARACIAALAFFLTAPAVPGGRLGAAVSDAPADVTIAYQRGLGYTNLIVVRESRVLEKQFPATRFEWKVLANGAAIRDGMIAGQIQIGAGGAGAFLIAWDRGVGSRLIAALNEINLWLVTRDPKVRSIRDLSPSMKIGMPGPDAIQGLVLRKAAQQLLGNAHAFDQSIVAVEHPLGVQALAAGQLDAHLSAPPFQQQEVDAGGHVILRSYDVFGRGTFNSVYTTESFARDHPLFIRAFYRAVVDATKFITTDRDKTAEYLSKESDGKVPAERFKRWLAAPDVSFTTTPHAFLKYARFMREIGLISKVPSSVSDIELPLLKGAGD
jgi:ABC-type nitrate/sulfonate/bicarbonate transport system substrate-binding protein